MNRNYSAVCALTMIAFIVLGCSWTNPLSGNSNTGTVNSSRNSADNPNSNRSLTDVAIDTAVGEQKIGIPECDQVMDHLTSYANNPDDNFAVRAAKGVFVGKIKDTIRQNLEQKQADKAGLAKVCREAKIELDKYRSQGAQ